MEMLLSLWLPILASSVVVFIASFLAWTVLPHHKKDWEKLPVEDDFIRSLKDLKIEPGRYMYPYYSSPDEMKSGEFQKKWKEGPVGILHVWRGSGNMGQNMALTLVFYFIVSLFIGYLGSLALKPGDSFSEVFQVTGTAGILAYCCGGIPNAIWFQQKFLSNLVDGIAYGLITGAMFGLLWPGA